MSAPRLRHLLQTQSRILRAVEVHSGVSALVAEHARGAQGQAFDAIWSSSLTSSCVRGRPDIEVVDTTTRLQIVEEAREVTSKPVIYDADTGGNTPEQFYWVMRSLHRAQVDAAIIEDKAGLKQNSLFGTERKQELADIDDFVAKIKLGKKASEEVQVFARLEALIAGAGEDEAIKRADAYLNRGGCDGIMVHSKQKDPAEVVSFCRRFRKELDPQGRVPIVAVPTTYNSITEKELEQEGVRVVIYANQLLRASYPAMLGVAESILTNSRSLEVDSQLMGVKKIITLLEPKV